MRIWSQEAEEYLPLQRRLTQSANDWVQAPENEKNASLWHNNPRLPQLQHLLEESVHHNGHSLGFFGRSWQSAFPSTEIFEGQTWLNRRETEFVKQSILQKGKNLRRLIATVVVIILVLSGLTIFAFTQQGIANEQRTIADEERNAAVTSEANAEERRIIAVTAEAEAQEQRDIAVSAEATAVAERDIALSRQLAIQADSELSNNDYSLALLLAIESGAASDTVEAFQVLREVLAQPARISQVFPGHFANVNSIEWSPDGRHILTASSDATARKWDVESGAEDLNIRSVYGPLQRAVWSPDGSPSFLTIGTSVENTLQMWDAETGDEFFERLRAGINDLQWSADGKRLLTAHIDGTAHIYDAEQGELLAELTGHQGEIKSVSWNGDETRILTVSNDGSAGLWDGMSGGLIETFGGKTEDVLSQALWSPDGQRILTADNIGNIQIWDADDGQPLLSLPNEEESRRIAAWNPAGTEIVTGSRNGTAAVWDAASGVQLRHFKVIPIASGTLRGTKTVRKSLLREPTRFGLGSQSGRATF